MDTSHIRTKENEARLVSLNVISRDSTLFSPFGIETPKRDKRRHDVVDIRNRSQLWSNGRNLTSPSSQEVILPPPSLLTHLHALVSHIIGVATHFPHVLEECSEALLAS
jgi:hypothetical protein